MYINYDCGREIGPKRGTELLGKQTNSPTSNRHAQTALSFHNVCSEYGQHPKLAQDMSHTHAHTRTQTQPQATTAAEITDAVRTYIRDTP